MKLNTKSMIAATASVAVAATMVSGPAVAKTETSSDVVTREAPSSTDSQAKQLKYDDVDVVGLLVFGKGRIASDQPKLAKKFDVGLKDSEVPPEAIQEFTDELLSVDNKFHEVVTTGVQIQDEEAAQEAIKRLQDDIDKIAAKYQNKAESSKGSVEPQGKGKFKTNYVVASNIVAGRDAVVAVELALAAYVAGVAVIAYKFDDTEPTSIEMERTFKELADL